MKYILITLLSFVLLAATCKVQKNIEQVKTVYDSTAIRQVDSLITLKKKDSSRYENTIRQLKKTGVVFKNEPCPPMPDIDSACSKDSLVKVIKAQAEIIKSQSNKVRILTDGTIEAEGQIIDANYTISSFQQTLEQKDITIDSMAAHNDTISNQLSRLTEQYNKSVNKKSGFQWWLLIGGIVIGCLLWNYTGERIKKFLKKKSLS